MRKPRSAQPVAKVALDRVRGGDDSNLKQHVDNPGQTPMVDNPGQTAM